MELTNECNLLQIEAQVARSMQCFAGGIEALKNRVPNYTQDSRFESFHLCGNMPLLRFVQLMLSLWPKIHTIFFYFAYRGAPKTAGP